MQTTCYFIWVFRIWEFWNSSVRMFGDNYSYLLIYISGYYKGYRFSILWGVPNEKPLLWWGPIPSGPVKTQKLLWVILKNFREASLIRHDWLYHWCTVINSISESFSCSCGRGHNGNLYHTVAFLLPVPTLKISMGLQHPESFLHTKNMSIIPEGLRSWGVMCYWSRKDQRLIFFLSHQLTMLRLILDIRETGEQFPTGF